MSLSKPLYKFLGFYFEQLFEHPVRTRAISASVIALTGNYTSQKISGKPFKSESLLSFGLYGLLFGGSVPYYFYSFIERIIPDVRIKNMLQFFAERMLFAPFFTALSLFFLSIFEGKTVDESMSNLLKLYKPVLYANWSWLSLPYFLNFTMVPPLLRVLVMNMIGFCWIIFIANVRRKAAQKKEFRDLASK